MPTKVYNDKMWKVVTGYLISRKDSVIEHYLEVVSYMIAVETKDESEASVFLRPNDSRSKCPYCGGRVCFDNYVAMHNSVKQTEFVLAACVCKKTSVPFVIERRIKSMKKRVDQHCVFCGSQRINISHRGISFEVKCGQCTETYCYQLMDSNRDLLPRVMRWGGKMKRRGIDERKEPFKSMIQNIKDELFFYRGMSCPDVPVDDLVNFLEHLFEYEKYYEFPTTVMV